MSERAFGSDSASVRPPKPSVPVILSTNGRKRNIGLDFDRRIRFTRSRRRRLFCGCHTYVGSSRDTGPYLDALEAELARILGEA